MKRVSVLLYLLISSLIGMSQTSAIWGVSNKGIFKTDENFKNPELLTSFSNLQNLDEDKLLYNRAYIHYFKEYGAIIVANSEGLYEYNSNSNKLTTLFNGTVVSPVKGEYDKLYFISNSSNSGIYSYDFNSKKVELMAKFSSETGYKGTSLVKGPDEYYYGATTSYSGYKSTLFQFLPSSKQVSALYDFGSESVCGQIVYSNKTKKIWGIKGCFIFAYSPTQSKLTTIQAIGGCNSISGLTEIDGVFYGTNNTRGKNNYGFLFSYYEGANGVRIIHNFTSQTGGAYPAGPLTVISNNKLIGWCLDGGKPVSHPYIDYDGGTYFTIDKSSINTIGTLYDVINILKGFSPRSNEFIKQREVIYLTEMPISISKNYISDKSCGKDYVLNGTSYGKSGNYVQYLNNSMGGDSIIFLNLLVSKLAGDLNCNGVYEEGEVAGDTNKNGKIDALEIAGDVNGNGAIDGFEKVGDVNGNEKIDRYEISGDKDGNGAINGKESVGSFNPNTSYSFNLDNTEKVPMFSYDISEFTNDTLITLEINASSNYPELNLGGLELMLSVDINGQELIDSITISADKLKNGETVSIYKTMSYLETDKRTKLKVFSADGFGNDTLLYSYNFDGSNSVHEQPKKDQLFSVYPNPVKDQIILSFNEHITCNEVNLGLYNMQGKLLQSINHVNASQSGFAISVSHLPKGKYVLKGQCENKHFGTLINKN